MNTNAAPQASLKARFILVSLAAVAMLLSGLGATATAAPPIGKDGKIHACYRVKGKPKGSMRIVTSAKKRCRRGERRVAWSAGASAQAGGHDQAGSGGQPGASGSNGTSGSNEAALKTEIAALNLKLDALEGVLAGVTNEDLTGTMSTLQGLDNGDLLDAVDAAPLVESLCEQTPELAEQTNALQGVIGGLGLEPTLEAIGLLEIPELPDALQPSEFGCATP